MKLTNEQVKTYENQGFLLMPDSFSQHEINVLKAELPRLFDSDTQSRTLEKDGAIVRSVYGSHTTNEICRRLVHLPRLVEPAMQLLNNKVYIHQFKINAKAAFGGDAWEWHQDYIFWHKEDGLQKPQMINAVVFLDEVNEFNGPMFFIPGSHEEGIIDTSAKDEVHPAYTQSPKWISNLTVNLKYALSKATIARLVTRYGITAPKGSAGSVLFFHPNLVHGSSSNMSPFDRNIVITSYNSVDNIPVLPENARPEFLASRDYEPISPLAHDILCL